MRFFITLFFISSALSAQVSVKGNVADASSGRCIPYAAVGIPGKDEGTLTAENGSFEFMIRNADKKDKVLISAAGYKPRLVTADSLKSSKITIGLVPIKSKARTSGSKGKRDLAGNYADAHDQARSFLPKAAGEEEGVVIKNQDTLQINAFNFRINKLTYDSILLRVNLYQAQNNRPGERINLKDHYFQLSPVSSEQIRIKLDEAITVAGDFFVAIEYIKSDGGPGSEFLIHTFEDKKAETYYRKFSQGSWKKADVPAAGFWFEVER